MYKLKNKRKNCEFYLHVTFCPVIRDLKIHCFSVQVQVNYPCAYRKTGRPTSQLGNNGHLLFNYVANMVAYPYP